jgi:hypothetical protein
MHQTKSMKRRQETSAAEKKAQEHPLCEKKREKQRGSAIKTMKPKDSHTVHRVLMSTLINI